MLAIMVVVLQRMAVTAVCVCFAVSVVLTTLTVVTMVIVVMHAMVRMVAAAPAMTATTVEMVLLRRWQLTTTKSQQRFTKRRGNNHARISPSAAWQHRRHHLHKTHVKAVGTAAVDMSHMAQRAAHL